MQRKTSVLFLDTNRSYDILDLLIYMYLQPCHTVKLMTVLKLMLEKRGPDVYFNFSGQDGGVSHRIIL